jgi:hypothetical protein
MNTTRSILKEAKLDRRVWGKAIIEAERNGGFTGNDVAKAGLWTTCAVGLQRGIPLLIPYFKEGGPSDRDLRTLGRRFSNCVEHNKFVEAAQRLVDIENRAKIVRSGTVSNTHDLRV